MKRLSKEQAKQHDELSGALQTAHAALDCAIQKYNEKIAAAYAELQPVVETFNAKVGDVNDFIEAVHDDQQAYFDEKSEKWQEGDAGSSYQGWMEGWEFNVEEVELEEPVELEMPDIDIDSFEQIDTECPS